MPDRTPTLHMLCGKIASGKSTLAHQLAANPSTVLIAEDAWLDALVGDHMNTPKDFVTYSGRLQGVMGPHVTSLLQAGLSVVLDFQANTIEARRWMRGVFEAAHADHRLHILDVPDAVCLDRLHLRNAQGDHPFAATEQQFHLISRHFQPPTPGEGFHIEHHGT